MRCWIRRTGVGAFLLGLATIVTAQRAHAQGYMPYGQPAPSYTLYGRAVAGSMPDYRQPAPSSVVRPMPYYIPMYAPYGQMAVAPAGGQPTATGTAVAPPQASCARGCGGCGAEKSCEGCENANSNAKGEDAEGMENCRACACGSPERAWFRGEYLHWWTKGARVPPLAGTVTNLIDPRNSVDTLFGSTEINGGLHEGVRFATGLWLDDTHDWGIEGDYFDLGRHNSNYASGQSNGFPNLVRPFINAQDSLPDGEVIAYPRSLDPVQDAFARTGSITVKSNDYFQSAGAWVRRAMYCRDESSTEGNGEASLRNLWRGCGSRWIRVEGLAGYRYFRFMDEVDARSTSVLVTDNGPDLRGTQFDIHDSFRAHNEFQGIDLGMVVRAAWGRWELEAVSKTSLGNNHERVDINGQTTVTDPLTGVRTDYAGGLLAQTTSNIGHHVRDRFATIPQLSVQLGYQLTPHFHAYAGYDVLYWDKVVRAGEQIDPVVDPGNIPRYHLAPTTTRPNFEYREASFWAQGFRLGGEFRF